MALNKGKSNKKNTTEDKEKKRLKQEAKTKAKAEQEENKKMLEALSKANNKRNKYTVSKYAIQELKNPNLVYILGGNNNGHYTYIHSHQKTWSTGLHTAEVSMRRMLEELVAEQKGVIGTRIIQINNLWKTQVFDKINEEEHKMGNNVNIQTWEDFIHYYNDLEQIGQSANLKSILNYKMAQSAASALDYHFGRESYEDYVGRLLHAHIIDKKTAQSMLCKDIKTTPQIKELQKVFKAIAEQMRAEFIGDDRVRDWLESFKNDASTKSIYGASIEVQKTLKPNSKELGKITEFELSTKSENAIINAYQDDIINSFETNVFNIISQNIGLNKGAYHTLASGESYGQKGGLDNKINKADLILSISVGDIIINIPSSVKLSMAVKNISQNNNIVTVTTEDLFSANASSANLNFNEINKHVGSESYKENQNKINSLIRYVYNNAGAIPSSNMRSFIRFNNSIIYYLAWLEICTKIVGNPKDGHNQQLAMALESIGSIHNTADILEKLKEITPAKIKDFLIVMSNPARQISYSSYSQVQFLQTQIDLLISKLWEDFLNNHGKKPDYKLIYGRAFNILSNNGSITNKKMPSLSIMYRIKMNNIRTLSI